MRRLTFRTVEDPSVEPRPQRCPWPDADVFLGGRMLALERDDELGSAHACARITEALVPGADVPFYAEFAFSDGVRHRAEGSARIVVVDVPVRGAVLAVCALRLLDAAGIAASTSVFNAGGASGVETGSVWTLLIY